MIQDLIPANWETGTLGTLVVVERGSSPRPIKNFITNVGGVNWIKIGDMKEGQKFVVRTAERITEEGASKSRFVGVGDFILSNSMSFGRPYIMAIEGYIHDGWFALRLPSLINSEYFYYLLSSSLVQDQFQLLAVGGVVKNISGDLVKQAVLPLPPLAEQKVIAEKLDTLLAQVDNTKARLERIPEILKRFRQSVLAAAVSGKLTEEWRERNDVSLEGWIETNLGALATVATGKTPSRSNSEYWDGGLIPWLTSAATGAEYTLEAEQFVTEHAVKECSLRVFPIGTLLLAMYGEGKTRGQVTEIRLEATCNQACAAILVDTSKASKEFLKLRLQENYEETRKAAAGGAQPNLNLNKVREIPVQLPEIVEQAEIVRRVEELFAFADRVEHAAQAALSRVNNLTQSILAKAFRGELTADWRAANPDLISGENSAVALLAKIRAERAALIGNNRGRKAEMSN